MQVVEESYDIPRSHHLPYYLLKKKLSPTLPTKDSNLATKTEASDDNTTNITECTKQPRDHFYSNAAPSKMDNYFRYDFDEVLMIFFFLENIV